MQIVKSKTKLTRDDFWQKENGEKIKIKDLTNGHLLNIVLHLMDHKLKHEYHENDWYPVYNILIKEVQIRKLDQEKEYLPRIERILAHPYTRDIYSILLEETKLINMMNDEKNMAWIDNRKSTIS